MKKTNELLNTTQEKPEEVRHFYLCEDDHPDLYVSEVIRKPSELSAGLAALEIGQQLPGHRPNSYWIRHK